jgi:hypothetical protein
LGEEEGMTSYVGADGRVYGGLGQWRNLDRGEEGWTPYAIESPSMMDAMVYRPMEFFARDDDHARDIASGLMARYPPTATENEREMIDWLRRQGYVVTKTVTYEVASRRARKERG